MTLYFNNAFSKQPLEESVQAMEPFLRREYENPLTESEGAERCRAAISSARAFVSAMLGASPEEIHFVSSGTEANNWALKGVAAASPRSTKHIIISAIEHFSVYQTASYLRKQGVDVTILPVDRQGRLDPGDISKAIRPDTILVSVNAGSDEIGVIQDLSAVAELKRRFSDVCFHTDAVQYLCYESLDAGSLPFDLVSCSSNALYGPAGIAALFVRQGTRLIPLLHGGMQEEGMRPGLQSVALIAGFGAAAEANRRQKVLWREKLRDWQNEMFALFDRLAIPVTASRAARLVDNVHGIVDVDGEALLTLLLEDSIRASTGSTCYQYAQKESHVLQAIGLNREHARGAVLFTGSIYGDRRSHARFGECLEESLQSLRALKPW